MAAKEQLSAATIRSHMAKKLWGKGRGVRGRVHMMPRVHICHGWTGGSPARVAAAGADALGQGDRQDDGERHRDGDAAVVAVAGGIWGCCCRRRVVEEPTVARGCSAVTITQHSRPPS